MDFIKKNWGLLTGGVIALALAVVLVVMVLKAVDARNEANKKVDEHMAFFKKLADFGYNLEKTDANGEIFNLAQSKRNFEAAQAQSQIFRNYLIDTYQIEVNVPETSSEAVRLIKARVDKIKKFLAKNGITANDIGAEFMDILETGTISQEDFKPVFRQLAIIDRVLENVAACGIKEINYLIFPMGFSTVEAGGYTTTPFDISVYGSPAEVQNFLNVMTDDGKMLFYITDLVFNSPDVFTESYEDKIVDYELTDSMNGLEDTGFGTGSSRSSRKNGAMGALAGLAGPMSTPKKPSVSRTPAMPKTPRASVGARGSQRNTPGMLPGAPATGRRQRNAGAPMVSGGVAGRSGGVLNPLLGGNNGMGMTGGYGQAGLQKDNRIVLDPKRQDWIVFDEKVVELNVRFDLYEFVAPEEPEAEDAEAGNADDSADEADDSAADEDEAAADEAEEAAAEEDADVDADDEI